MCLQKPGCRITVNRVLDLDKEHPVALKQIARADKVLNKLADLEESKAQVSP